MSAVSTRKYVGGSEELLRDFVNDPTIADCWVVTNGRYASSRVFKDLTGFLDRRCPVTNARLRADGSMEDLYPGWWVFNVPISLRDKLDENGQLRVLKPAMSRISDPDIDSVTARLVASSIPAYRNSDRCPKPNCGRVGYFKQMALCCDIHGAFHP